MVLHGVGAQSAFALIEHGAVGGEHRRTQMLHAERGCQGILCRYDVGITLQTGFEGFAPEDAFALPLKTLISAMSGKPTSYSAH